MAPALPVPPLSLGGSGIRGRGAATRTQTSAREIYGAAAGRGAGEGGASAAAAPPCRQGPRGSPPPTPAAPRVGVSQATPYGEHTGVPPSPRAPAPPSAPPYPSVLLISVSLHPPGVPAPPDPAPPWAPCTIPGSPGPCTHPAAPLNPAPPRICAPLHPQILPRGPCTPRSGSSLHPCILNPQTLHLRGSLPPNPRLPHPPVPGCCWGAPACRGVPPPSLPGPGLPCLPDFFSLSAGRGKASPGSAELSAPAKSRGDEPGLRSAFQPRICCCMAGKHPKTPSTQPCLAPRSGTRAPALPPAAVSGTLWGQKWGSSVRDPASGVRPPELWLPLPQHHTYGWGN